jgi:hypothetical protein
MQKNLLNLKKIITVFCLISIIMTFSVTSFACTGDGPGGAEEAAGDTKENGEDGGEKSGDEKETPGPEETAEPSYKILYQLTRHRVTKTVNANVECYLFNFSEFLDGGLINRDGSDNKILQLKKYPTSRISSRELNNYYYVYSPNNPVEQISGFDFFNWDIEGQELVEADFETSTGIELQTSPPERYPGIILASPENMYLAYPMTVQKDSGISQGSSFMQEKFNPFLSDSNLVIMNSTDGSENTVLENTYNRQLFSSFAQFSVRDDYFYTIAIENNSFRFVRISTDTGTVTDFSEAFPYFEWSELDWDEFFPRSGDFSYASFSLSPDEERMVIYKNIYVADIKNPCSSEANHKLWILNLEDGSVDFFDKQNGYVTDVSWNPDGSQKFALSINSHSGCYPDYITARIDIVDKNGDSFETIMTAQKSKTISIGWSPDGETIAYDIYSTDFIGHLNLINLEDKKVEELTSTSEIINNGLIEEKASGESPITIIFVGWL